MALSEHIKISDEDRAIFEKFWTIHPRPIPVYNTKDRDRQIVEDRDIHGMTLSEIAEKHGINYNTATKAYWRVKDREG